MVYCLIDFIMDTSRLSPILLWSCLEKYIFYQVDDFHYIDSGLFSNKTLVVCINATYYYCPKSHWKTIEKMETPFYIYPKEKEKVQGYTLKLWISTFYQTLDDLVLNEFTHIRRIVDRCHICDEMYRTNSNYYDIDVLHTCISHNAYRAEEHFEEKISAEKTYNNLPITNLRQSYTQMSSDNK